MELNILHFKAVDYRAPKKLAFPRVPGFHISSSQRLLLEVRFDESESLKNKRTFKNLIF